MLRIDAGMSTLPKERFTGDLSALLFTRWATIAQAVPSRSHTSSSFVICGRVSLGRNMSMFAPRNACSGSKTTITALISRMAASTSELVNVMPAVLFMKYTLLKSPPSASIRPRNTGKSSSTDNISTLPGKSTSFSINARPVVTWATTAHMKAVLPLPLSPCINVPLPIWK